jgi:hypothetical protein
MKITKTNVYAIKGRLTNDRGGDWIFEAQILADDAARAIVIYEEVARQQESGFPHVEEVSSCGEVYLGEWE